MPSGEHFHSMYRTSYKRYTSRPPSSCRAARAAWDIHVEKAKELNKGAVVWLQLLNGYWGAKYESGDLREIENCGLV